MESLSKAVKKYFNAFEKQDREFAENLLSKNFTFTSPYDDHIGKTAYFEKCWSENMKNTKYQILELVENEHEAFVTYEARNQNGEKFRNTELFKFDGGKLKEVQVFFGQLPKEMPAH
jgi:ketosteroid isomerase-like protein